MKGTIKRTAICSMHVCPPACEAAHKAKWIHAATQECSFAWPPALDIAQVKVQCQRSIAHTPHKTIPAASSTPAQPISLTLDSRAMVIRWHSVSQGRPNGDYVCANPPNDCLLMCNLQICTPGIDLISRMGMLV